MVMVRFKENSFIIEVEAAGNPVEEWLKTQEELIDMLQNEREEDVHITRVFYLELLRSMMPDLKTAKKMNE